MAQYEKQQLSYQIKLQYILINHNWKISFKFVELVNKYNNNFLRIKQFNIISQKQFG